MDAWIDGSTATDGVQGGQLHAWERRVREISQRRDNVGNLSASNVLVMVFRVWGNESVSGRR